MFSSWNLPVGESRNTKPSGVGTATGSCTKADSHQVLLGRTLGQRCGFLRSLQNLVSVVQKYHQPKHNPLYLAPLHQHSCFATEKFGSSVRFYKEDRNPATVMLVGTPFAFVFKIELLRLESKLLILRNRVKRLIFTIGSFHFFYTCGRSQLAQLQMQNWYSLKNNWFLPS